jgi:hypothetical protein
MGMSTESPCGAKAQSRIQKERTLALVGAVAALWLELKDHRTLSDVTKHIAEAANRSADYRVALCQRSVAATTPRLIATPYPY